MNQFTLWPAVFDEHVASSFALVRIPALWLSPQDDHREFSCSIAGTAAAACYPNKPEAVYLSHNKARAVRLIEL